MYYRGYVLTFIYCLLPFTSLSGKKVLDLSIVWNVKFTPSTSKGL